VTITQYVLAVSSSKSTLVDSTDNTN